MFPFSPLYIYFLLHFSMTDVGSFGPVRPDVRSAANIFVSPGLPSLCAETLLQEYFYAQARKENLARLIPQRVFWDDIIECITEGLKREGFE